jgi:hypothetical protein
MVNEIEFNPKYGCFRFTLRRNKTRRHRNSKKITVYSVFIHYESFECCALDSLATLELYHQSIGKNQLFPLILNPEASCQYMNSFLKSIESQYVAELNGADRPHPEDGGLTKGVTSHGPRPGGATILMEHPDIQFEEIHPRGGWTLSRMSVIFRYIRETFKSDAKCARAVSLWPDANRGGLCPHLVSIPEVEKNNFLLFCYDLIPRPTWSDNARTALVCILLLRHNTKKHLYPGHFCVQRVEYIALKYGGQATLEHWITLVCDWFQSKNALFVNDGNENNEVHATIHDYITRTAPVISHLCSSQQQQTIEIREVKALVEQNNTLMEQNRMLLLRLINNTMIPN